MGAFLDQVVSFWVDDQGDKRVGEEAPQLANQRGSENDVADCVEAHHQNVLDRSNVELFHVVPFELLRSGKLRLQQEWKGGLRSYPEVVR